MICKECSSPFPMNADFCSECGSLIRKHKFINWYDTRFETKRVDNYHLYLVDMIEGLRSLKNPKIDYIINEYEVKYHETQGAPIKVSIKGL